MRLSIRTKYTQKKKNVDWYRIKRADAKASHGAKAKMLLYEGIPAKMHAQINPIYRSNNQTKTCQMCAVALVDATQSSIRYRRISVLPLIDIIAYPSILPPQNNLLLF